MLNEEISILVVDDVNAMCVQIKDLLRMCGFRKVTQAANGEEAKLCLITDTFHLILCDWHMEPTDGLDLLRYVRAAPDLVNTAFIMITAESTKELVMQALKAGVDSYLLKPLTKAQIETKVYSVLLKKELI